MYLLGHLGIAAGAVYASQRLLLRTKPASNDSIDNQSLPDFRVILAGLITPDLIDKPIGFLLFGTTRVFGHSLMFYGLILLLGLMIFKKKANVVLFGLAAAVHLVEDLMWRQPEVVLWPFYGFGFSPTEQQNVGERVNILLTQNYLFISEVAGGLILMALILRVTRLKSWRLFFTTGHIK